MIPVITSVQHLSPDKVEIRRRIIYKTFHNTINSPEEVFIVDRSKMRYKNEVVMQMVATYPGFKTEALKIFSVGYTV